MILVHIQLLGSVLKQNKAISFYQFACTSLPNLFIDHSQKTHFLAETDQNPPVQGSYKDSLITVFNLLE